MNGGKDSWTTASIEQVSPMMANQDPTPGLLTIYSRLHAELPSGTAFASEATTFGRDPDNLLCIPEAAVSRYHGRAEMRTDGYWLVDSGSTNGILVNGIRISRHLLADHDVVRIGDSLFRYTSGGIYAFGAYRVDGTIIESARPVRRGAGPSALVGGYQIDALLDRVEKVARTELSVVITGESGTGKELLARRVHEASGRPGPFQAINCGALPANLIESELFGHQRGAFTGAHGEKQGLLRAADCGTLFLDEIGDMPLDAQVKLLRVLQERVVLPIGATSPIPIDIRVVCATHRDLERRVSDGQFRGDLLARIREYSAHIPPLRERREDIYPLVRHFLAKAGLPDAVVTLPYMVGLAHYSWPYNVRELESAVRLSVALSNPSQPLDLTHLPESIRQCLRGHGDRGSLESRKLPKTMPPAAIPNTSRSAPAPVLPPRLPSALLPREFAAPPGPCSPAPYAPTEASLRQLLTTHAGNIAAVGRAVGKERMQIHRWLKKFSIDIADYRR